MIGYAASVPRITLTGATMPATITELSRAWRRFVSANASRYHSVVNPLQGSEKTIESLNEKMPSMTSGPYSSRMNRMA